MLSTDYGVCDICNEKLVPVWYTDYEYDKNGFRTGRQRLDVNYLECPCCDKKFTVDDSFAMPWH